MLSLLCEGEKPNEEKTKERKAKKEEDRRCVLPDVLNDDAEEDGRCHEVVFRWIFHVLFR